MEPKHARIAQTHFDAAGISDRVEIRVGEASALLDQLRVEGSFDFVFIDADEQGYPEYLDWALEHTRLGGVIPAHHVFRGGSMAGARQDDDQSESMRLFNRRIAGDERLVSTIFPASDGTIISFNTARICNLAGFFA